MNEEEHPPACVDCAHCVPDERIDCLLYCLKAPRRRGYDVILGEAWQAPPRQCLDVRILGDCGKEGAWFEPKPAPKEVAGNVIEPFLIFIVGGVIFALLLLLFTRT